MVRHVILWQFKDELSAPEREAAAAKAKAEHEALVGVVPGLVSLSVATNPLDTSNVSLMLDSTLESKEALAGYAVHPEHVKAATNVRNVVKSRYCMDFEF